MTPRDPRAPLAVLATLALLAALVLCQPAVLQASPALLVLDSRASAQIVPNSTSFTMTLTLPPYTLLVDARVACVANASSVEASSSAAQVRVAREGSLHCIYATASNPTPQFTRLELQVRAHPLEEQPAQLPVGLLAATVAVGAASYLFLTERGRDLAFKALSIPVAYALVGRENVLENARRRLIYEYIRKNPGAGPRAISRDLGISFGEVQWHLSVLERVGLVARVSLAKNILYYPAEMQLHEWLPAFAKRELGVRVGPEHVRRNEYRIRAMLARGCTLPELKAALSQAEPQATL